MEAKILCDNHHTQEGMIASYMDCIPCQIQKYKDCFKFNPAGVISEAA